MARQVGSPSAVIGAIDLASIVYHMVNYSFERHRCQAPAPQKPSCRLVFEQWQALQFTRRNACGLTVAMTAIASLRHAKIMRYVFC